MIMKHEQQNCRPGKSSFLGGGNNFSGLNLYKKYILTMALCFFSVKLLAIDAEVKMHNGIPALFLDGNPHIAIMRTAWQPIFLSAVKEGRLSSVSKESATSWLLISKAKLPKEGFEINVKMAFGEPDASYDCSAYVQIEMNEGRWTFGLGGNNNNRRLALSRSAVMQERKSKNFTKPFSFEFGKIYDFTFKYAGDEASLYLNGELREKVKDFPIEKIGELGVAVFRGRGIWEDIIVKNLHGDVIFKETWKDNKITVSQWYNKDHNKIQQAIDSDIDIVKVAVNTSDSMREDGSFDFSRVKDSCNEALKINPKLKVLFRLSLVVPIWYQHKSYVIAQKIDGSFVTRESSYSYDNREWLNDCKRFFEALNKHLEQEPYGANVIGYLIMMGAGGEFVYEFGDSMFHDYSIEHLSSFRKYLRKKYSDDVQTFQKAWGMNSINFENAKLLTPKERVHFSDWSNWVDIDKSQLPIAGYGNSVFPSEIKKYDDFMEFHNKTIADFICELAVVAKRSKQKRIVGAFFGYVVSGHANVFDKGHNNIADILNNSDLDFLASPYSYEMRNTGTPCVAQLAERSVLLHNKLPLIEDDTRTPLIRKYRDDQHLVGGNHEETLEILKRNFASSLQSGGAIWYLDFNDTWFLHNDITQLFKRFSEISNDSLKYDRSSNSDIVLIIDPNSWKAIYPAPAMRSFVKSMFETLPYIGAPFDTVLLSDLDKIKDYKLYIFLNAFFIDENMRKIIDKRIKTKGKTALFYYAPGYRKGYEYSEKFIKDLCNIDVKMSNIKGDIELKDKFASRKLGASISPIFYVDDKAAEILGKIKVTKIIKDDGSRTKSIEYDGIAKKNIDGFISIYSAIPNLSLQQLRNIAEDSGVKMITPINHVVFGNNFFLAIYSREDGEIIITPNSQIKSLKELFTNEVIELNEGKAKVKVTKNKLIFFTAIPSDYSAPQKLNR